MVRSWAGHRPWPRGPGEASLIMEVGSRHRDFLAIVGPTASGKTGLSLRVGARLCAEIISMDSRQIYRGMDVGTGKVGLRERALLPHHGLDLLDPDQAYSAGHFARDARRWIQEIRGRGRVPLLVGGTGFFLKALTHPMFQEPELDRRRLKMLRSFLNGLDDERLERYLAVLDAEVEDPSQEDRQRATRRVEMALLTGRSLSWWHARSAPAAPPLKGLIVLLNPPRDELYEAINERVARMMEAGWPEEVRRLLEAGYGPEDPGMTGAGYPEIVAYLGGEKTMEEAVEEIRRAHRRYARRQGTWFRHQLPPGSLVLDGGESLKVMTDRVVAAWGGA